ncbi:DUF3492 domain-containing protein [Streptomyces sp. PsTaAH-124]|uniref:DUF3492 domain-containing protein n=1 Tax=Streptomyces sp. PsTaAH-124 TaxID=1157638 RepID=UPI000375C2EC|nr:DUF3492 domain-containing protein [Streptomyces sp. PsTaAH-124]
MRIGLVTEGGYPYASGDGTLWCERLVRGLGQHEFDLYALSRSRRQEDDGWVPLPRQVGRVRTAPLWGTEDTGARHGRRARRRFAEYYGELAAVLCATGAAGRTAQTAWAGQGGQGGRAAWAGQGGRAAWAGQDGAVPVSRSDDEADRFAYALYGLAELARDTGGGLAGALRSESAVRALERACRAPGAHREAREARVPDLLGVAVHVEHALRPLTPDWYGDDGLGAADLCHTAGGGTAALPGLLARHFCDVPLLVTEYGAPLRAHHLAATAARTAPAVRSLLAAFHARLAAEVYRQAAVITHGNAHTRRWQERCGADRARLRTVPPGMDATPFAEAGETGGVGATGGAGATGGSGGAGARTRAHGADTLVWTGRVEPAKDLVSLLHAFTEVRWAHPGARLRIVATTAAPDGPEAAGYLAHCKALAAQLFPDEAEGPHTVGENPVSFEEVGGPEAPTLADAYAAGAVVVLSSVVEGFPSGLVEAMFSGCATVSTDVGAVVEVIGGTGLVVPPRNPRALGEACVALLRDPERRARLGAAARARALELFTVEQNIAAFHSIYLEVVSRCPVRRVVLDDSGEPLPFAAPAESHLAGPPGFPGPPDRRTGPAARHPGTAASPGSSAAPVRTAPSWAAAAPDRTPTRRPATEAAR